MVERVKWWRRCLSWPCCWSPVAVRTPRPEPRPDARRRFATLDRLAGQDGRRSTRSSRGSEATSAARRDEIARQRRSPTVEASLRVARLTGRITPGVERAMRKDWTDANAALAQAVAASAPTELGYVVGTVRTLAAAHMLTADRLRPTFLILRTNTRFWATAPCRRPASGRTFGRDPAIFQYYPGHGLQLQPLASWGRANAIAGACLAALRIAHDQGHAAARRADALSLDRLAVARRAPQRLPRVGVLLRLRHRRAAVGERDDAGDGDPGALARLPRAGQQALAARGASGALGAFEQAAAERRVASPRPGGTPLPPVLVRAVAPRVQRRPAGRDRPARRGRAAALQRAPASCSAPAIARRGARSTTYDTGAWSLYSEHGAESTLNYHELTAGFLGGLCDRTDAQVLLPREPELRALRARADADRPGAAARARAGTARAPCASRSRRSRA